jgi:ketopantoate reductase
MIKKVTRPRACVVGAGAVGGLFIQALAKAGWEMTTLARGETLEVIRNEACASTMSAST